MWGSLTQYVLSKLNLEGLVAMLSLVIIGHIAWACGWLPGIPGFALVSQMERLREDVTGQVTGLQEDVQNTRVEQLEEQIFSQHIRLCEAQSPEAAQSHRERLSRLLRRYRMLTGIDYPLQQCNAI